MHKWRAKHVLSVIWNVELHGVIRCYIWLKETSRSTQLRSNFIAQNFLAKSILVWNSFIAGFKKYSISLRTANKSAKSCVPKMWRHPLYLFFFTITQPNLRIPLSKFVGLLLVYRFITYISFWINSKLLFLYAFISEKRSSKFLGPKWERIENLILPFSKRFSFTSLGIFRMDFTSS